LAETTSEKEASDRNDVLIPILTNLAICLNKKEEWSKTMNYIGRLESLVDVDNQPKILYAKGRALMNLGENGEASDALAKAVKLRPSDHQIIAAIVKLKQRNNSYEDFQKSFAKNLKI
jgi:tetratricopeptide (TPR) repeat protein